MASFTWRTRSRIGFPHWPRGNTSWIPYIFFFVTLVWNFDVQTPLVWNSSETWLDFHIRYCGHVCVNNSRLNRLPQISCPEPACFPCECEPTCTIYGTCCPSEDPPLHVDIQETPFPDNVPKPDWFTCTNLPGKTGSIFMISDCYLEHSGEVKNIHTKLAVSDEGHPKDAANDLCTNPDTGTLNDVTPYVDLHHGIIFRNQFCAICNGYSIGHDDSALSSGPVASAMELSIQCVHYQTMYQLTSELDFFNAAIVHQMDNDCSVDFSPPKPHLETKACDPHWHEKPEVQCNTSNTLYELCHNLSEPYLRIAGSQNVFCHLCSGKQLYHRPCINSRTVHFSVEDASSQFESPISLLLGASSLRRDKYSPVDSNCEHSYHWQNSEGDCVPANCSSGKLPRANGTCFSVLTQIRGLGYRLALVFLPEQENVTVTRDNSQTMVEYFHDMLKEIISDEHEFQVNMIVQAPTGDTGDGEILSQLSLEAYIIGSTLQPRDEFETEMLDFIQGNWTINLTDTDMVALKLQTIGVEFLHYQNEQITPVTVELPHFTTLPEWTSVSYRFYPTRSIYTLLTPSTPAHPQTSNSVVTWMKQYTLLYTSPRRPRRLWSLKDLFIDVTHSLVCPYVVTNVTDIAMVGDKIVLTFEHNGKLVNVTGGQDVSLVDGKVRLCLKLFKQLTKSAWRRSHDPLAEAKHYFEVVCVWISVACLLMSFITYSLFPTLRSLPGFNNMSLCISLALAQTLLVVTVRHGVRGHLSTGHCFFHALVLHYAWLSAIMWMSMCCVHMYRVFTCKSNKFTNPGSERKRYLHYCVLAFGIPVLIVILTVSLNAALTSGRTYGYDDKICFLDTRTSLLTIILSLLVPLCVTIVINSILFFITIREIVYVTSLQPNTRERQGVITYVKLSTLTGIFCIVCVVAVQLDSPVPSFLTSPLMTLQGALIFFSFIFNRRVGKLYCDLFGCQAPRWLERTTTTDSNQKMISTTNEGQKHAKSSTETTRI